MMKLPANALMQTSAPSSCEPPSGCAGSKLPTRPRAILFDWDNTLVNTWPIIHDALHKTFTQMGHEPWTMEMVKARVSRSMRDSFPLIFGENWQEAGDIYQKHFRAIHLQRLEAMPGAAEMLAYLSQQPVYMAVVSNKKGHNLRTEAKHIGWDRYFTKIIGADDTSRDKPHPDPVHASLAGSDITPDKDVWFIGDSPIDMECAHATGCLPVWFGDIPAQAMPHPYDRQVANHAELQTLLRKVF